MIAGRERRGTTLSPWTWGRRPEQPAKVGLEFVVTVGFLIVQPNPDLQVSKPGVESRRPASRSPKHAIAGPLLARSGPPPGANRLAPYMHFKIARSQVPSKAR